MPIIQFYHLLHTSLYNALPVLMEKALKAQMRAVIIVPSEKEREILDDALWTYRQNSFLPHAIEGELCEEEQPILITTAIKTTNRPDLLVITNGVCPEEIPENIEKIFDIFDGTNETDVLAARVRWKQYKEAGHTLRYIQQNAQGGWSEKNH